MAEIAEVKEWIRQTRTVKSISNDAILVHPLADSTRITLLDIACCIPALSIEKNIQHIDREDIARLSHWINHQH